jgi:hypothetical protein
MADPVKRSLLLRVAAVLTAGVCASALPPGA